MVYSKKVSYYVIWRNFIQKIWFVSFIKDHIFSSPQGTNDNLATMARNTILFKRIIHRPTVRIMKYSCKFYWFSPHRFCFNFTWLWPTFNVPVCFYFDSITNLEDYINKEIVYSVSQNSQGIFLLLCCTLYCLITLISLSVIIKSTRKYFVHTLL